MRIVFLRVMPPGAVHGFGLYEYIISAWRERNNSASFPLGARWNAPLWH